MKPIRGLFGGFLFGVMLIAGGWLVLAQTQESDTPPLPATELPESGNFYSAQNPNWPPLPGNVLGLSAWPLGDERFLLDDLDVDYSELQLEATLLQMMESEEGEPGPPGEGEGGDVGTYEYHPPVYGSNDLYLLIQSAVITGDSNLTATFVIHAPESDGTNFSYDLFATTNLSADVPGLNITNWVWLLRTEPGQTNVVVSNLWTETAFFRLGAISNSDPDWSFVQMEDLHAGRELYGDAFTNAMNTIVSNKVAWNIKLFISAGDLYENDSRFSFFTNDPGYILRMCAAYMTNQLWRLKSNGISVMAVEGNHEEKYAHISPYSWSSVFGTNFYANEPMYFTNRIADDTRDFAMKMTNGLSKYLFIGIGWINNPDTNYASTGIFATTNDMIAAYSNSCVWAKDLAASFSNHQVIAVSHYFVDTNGTPSTKDLTSDPDAPPAASYINIGPGIALWNQLKTLPNPFLVLSGHVRKTHMTTSTLTANDGHTVQSVKLNTQTGGAIVGTNTLNNGGTFVLYTVQPTLHRVVARVYAVELGRFLMEGEVTNNVYRAAFNFPTP